MRIRGWLSLAAGGLMLAMAPAALAATPPTAAVLSNGVVALGVGADGGISEASTGLQYLPGGVDGMLPNCACAPTLLLGSNVPGSSPESFDFTSVSAASSQVFQDAGTGGSLRLVQQVLPSASAPNLYEVVVTVENTGATSIDPTFIRPLAWADQPAGQPITEMKLDLGQIAPGGSQVFREYFGVGATLTDATSGFAQEGATLNSESVGTVAFAYGYGLGASPATATGGGGGGGGAGNSLTGTPPPNGNTAPVVNHPVGSGSSQVDNSPGGDTGQVTNPPQTDGPPAVSDSVINDDPPFGAPGLAPNPAATPELDSLTLMGSGGVSLASYLLIRRRARKSKR